MEWFVSGMGKFFCKLSTNTQFFNKSLQNLVNSGILLAHQPPNKEAFKALFCQQIQPLYYKEVMNRKLRFWFVVIYHEKKYHRFYRVFLALLEKQHFELSTGCPQHRNTYRTNFADYRG